MGCSLEFNIRQHILTDLARNIGECKDHASEHDLTPAIDLVTSHVQTRDQPAQDVEDGEKEEKRIFMVRRLSISPLDRQHRLIESHNSPLLPYSATSDSQN